ncbi:hypothetical protein GCM10012275_27750 [Longimycelium tulufanense]|uniref:HTH cro/C1-type domain-containing protein n=2 Tax=Longimycelium tulufanense TaxID=907463 RepID=A0A8J3CBL2_9PSEU|nr:hypothetical protein GCM10012275_27750 [Longimycelium tulufanense]
MSARQVAEVIGTSEVTVTRWETGERSPKLEDLANYLTIIGVQGSEREEIIELFRASDGPHWLSIGMPDLRQQLTALLELERMATEIFDVTPNIVPGLLQTADYTRTIMRQGGAPAEKIETRVAIRIGRRDVLHAETLRLTTIVGEAALRATVGGTRVMADQLRFLLKAAQWPSVDLRVIPLQVDWNPATEGPFFLLRFPDSSPVVYLENRLSGLFLHRPQDVAAYEQAATKILDVTLSPADSLGFISNQVTYLESL